MSTSRPRRVGRRALAGLGAGAVLGAALLASAPMRAAGGTVATDPPPAGEAVATFAGGCFWCMEKPFDELDGVISTTSGYTGGTLENPTYEQVSAGGTGHAEAVEVRYDPKVVDYAALLDVYWKNIDPLTADRQFCDAGTQYRSEIFTHGDEQAKLAQDSERALQASGRFDRPIVTRIEPAGPFYAAEDYHQDYYGKNPLRYRFYRTGCGRDARLEQLWGEPS